MKMSELTPEQQQVRREYNRPQQKKIRDKKALKQIAKMDATVDLERARRVNDEGWRNRLARNICFFGEVSPGVDAQTIQDAIHICREFARALDQPDVQQDESLRDFELRIGRVWAEQGGPFLNRKTQTLSPGWGTGTSGEGYWLPFEEKYKPLPGAAQKVDTEKLSPLDKIPDPAVPVAAPTPAPIEASAVQPGDEILERNLLAHHRAQLLGVPAEASRYLEGQR